ncbi:MAG: pyridoxamine 5'-phosphate oxidase family protein [Kordiimonadaceae bacterium]|nr:pyridoxamine 5'-phosphate oxidase family protein [Kordiimonadaceae bacterium]MBO6567965.1 pyridoxamine 5'-phosphate oxidase family protein [Kordiimonadaceae bacterium]MBO6964305.1 pyridoxamine 5'-phosphate oxidase family protein [Kordiimonadaceae bacterium]
MTELPTEFEKTPRNKVKRGFKRASYDRALVYDIIDSHFLCHVSFEKDGQPFVIPTSHWREGNKLYWHGSSKSMMIRHLAEGNPAAVAVTHLDGLVLARSAFNTSVNYRSVVAYGQPKLITDRAAFEYQMKLFFDRLAPGRWEALRPMTDQEFKATGLLEMDIEDAAAKVREHPPGDGDEADYPIWAGVVPISMQQHAPVVAPEGEGAPIAHPMMPAYNWSAAD